jgi:hypothetical protein
MPRTLTISEPTWKEAEVVIPDQCPSCGVDLTPAGSLKVWDWAASQFLLGEDDAHEHYGDSNWDETYTDSIHCKACDYRFDPGEHEKAQDDGNQEHAG